MCHTAASRVCSANLTVGSGAWLLPRLLAGCGSGPVFLADRRAPTAGRRTPALADTDPDTGRGWLS